MSMLFESTAIVSVNGLLYLYRYIYLKDDSILELLQSFAIATLVQLVIEWFFTSISLAIETRYQNIAVMAVGKKDGKDTYYSEYSAYYWQLQPLYVISTVD